MRLCKRPYKTVEEMNGDLIKRWNIKVGPNDDVYILGDMFFKHQDIQQVKDVLNKLNGKKHLIRGNHDKFLNSINWKEYFEEVVHYKEISDDNRMVILFHYPIEEWNGYYRNSYMLYGHVHENMKDIKKHPRKFNVGVDVNDFEPKTLDELIEANKVVCKSYHTEYGRPECWGTFEREYCRCGGDESECDFYPEKRKNTK
jgi:calcineurin-like phosphoesterase family protein